MELRRVGHTGLRVSALGLGTLTWGRDTDREDARQLLSDFLDAGGTLIDTAAHYGDGLAEQTIGDVIDQLGVRGDVVLASKAGLVEGADGPRIDCSRTCLLDSLDASLEALHTDHLELWLLDHFDASVPIDETLSALEVALRSGRIRYVGVANYPAWALAEIACLLPGHGGHLAVIETEYSLLNRSFEGELTDASAHFGCGVFAWSPLARGVLTGKYRSHTPPDSRAATPHLRGFVEPYLDARYAGTIEAVARAGEGFGLSAGQVALSWVKDAPGVTSTLLGPRTPGQLAQLLEVVDFALPHQIRKALDDVS
ncbi:aldo/keto reductase [Nanchangia anserum]|uniref:Aldo/keto reductase n=1 Tax=Nanchangia anserum TaxID=2692125 RepID=A0A8I0G7N6_9ACTO|nr:aldo/keto reductase [Nanchangia anserum]MBD3688679.1 aldo/keto reductase [Nanchangia anserum]QOX82430.1 aldo/keto reductase [Nanchangia anserum]